MGRLSNHQYFCPGFREYPLPAEPDPVPADVIVGALPVIIAAEIPDGVGGARGTFRVNRVKAVGLACFGNYFIWAGSKGVHRFALVIL